MSKPKKVRPRSMRARLSQLFIKSERNLPSPLPPLSESAGSSKGTEISDGATRQVTQTGTSIDGTAAQSDAALPPSRQQRPITPSSPPGLYELYTPPEDENTVVDVVVVHGLTGNVYNTWYCEETDTHWPADLLKEDFSDARVLAFAYDADVTHVFATAAASTNRLADHAENMLGALVRLREETDTEDRHVLFVCHSLGGLVVQKALALSRFSSLQYMTKVERSTAGVVFLGTPHLGAELARWGEYAGKLWRLVRQTNRDIVNVLEAGSEVLAEVQRDFQTLLRHRLDGNTPIDISCFYEELPVNFVGLVVPKSSARLLPYGSYGIHANHMNMVKFSAKSDPGYRAVRGEVLRTVRKLRQSVIVELTPAQEECLRSLHFPSMDTQLERIADAFSSTYRWIWDEDSCDFRPWLTAGKGVYWIAGKPGSGKSTMLKHLSAHPQTYEGLSGMASLENLGSPIVAIYCFSSGNDGDGSPSSSLECLLRSLLTQIVKQCPAVGLPVFGMFQHMKKLQPSTVWTVPKLHDLLLKVLDMASRQPLCLFIDALDEYDSELDAHHQPTISHYLYDISKHVIPYGRVCVSGRSLEFRDGLRTNPRLFVDRRTASDISLFVDARLHNMISQSSELAEIAQTLVKSANGVFLWVRLVAEVLLKSWARHEPAAGLKRRLTEIPQRLNELYGRIFEFILSEHGEEASVLLGLVGASIVPLSASSMRGALKLLGYESDQHFSARVYTLSSGLIEVRGRAVRFTHGSLRRHLQEYHVQLLAQGNSNLLKACLLQCRGAGEARKSPFAGYAICYWASHARRMRLENPEYGQDWARPSYKEFLGWYETFLCVSWQHPSLGSTLDDDLQAPRTQILSFAFSRARLIEILVFHSVNRSLKTLDRIYVPMGGFLHAPQSLLRDEGSGLSMEIGIESIVPRHGYSRAGWIGVSFPTLPSSTSDLATLWVMNDSQANPTAREIPSHPPRPWNYGIWLYAIEEYRVMLDYCQTAPPIAQLGNITPLQLACFLGLSKTVMLFLKNGADPNLFTEKSVFGTPLLAALSSAWLGTPGATSLAALPFRHYCIPALLAAGADPNQTAFGYHLGRSTSPIDLAIERFAAAIERDKGEKTSSLFTGALLADYVCRDYPYPGPSVSMQMGSIVRDLSDCGGFPSLRSRKIISASSVLVDFFRAASFAGAFARCWEQKLARFDDDPRPPELRAVPPGQQKPQREHKQQQKQQQQAGPLPQPGPAVYYHPGDPVVAMACRGISLPGQYIKQPEADRRDPQVLAAVNALRGISLPVTPGGRKTRYSPT